MTTYNVSVTATLNLLASVSGTILAPSTGYGSVAVTAGVVTPVVVANAGIAQVTVGGRQPAVAINAFDQTGAIVSALAYQGLVASPAQLATVAVTAQVPSVAITAFDQTGANVGVEAYTVPMALASPACAVVTVQSQQATTNGIIQTIHTGLTGQVQRGKMLTGGTPWTQQAGHAVLGLSATGGVPVKHAVLYATAGCAQVRVSTTSVVAATSSTFTYGGLGQIQTGIGRTGGTPWPIATGQALRGVSLTGGAPVPSTTTAVAGCAAVTANAYNMTGANCTAQCAMVSVQAYAGVFDQDTAYVWGSLANQGPSEIFNTPTLVSSIGGGGFGRVTALDAENQWVLFVLEGGIIYGVGGNANCQLASTPSDYIPPSSPVDVTTNQDLPGRFGLAGEILQVDGGDQWACAVDNLGYVWAWGQVSPNGFNPMGNNGSTSSLTQQTPAQRIWAVGSTSQSNLLVVSLSAYAIASGGVISAGANHGIALLSNQTVIGWGNNTYGQLGTGSNSITEYLVPVATINLTGIVTLSSGSFSSYALDDNGAVWAWGKGDSGQMGTGPAGNNNLGHLNNPTPSQSVFPSGTVISQVSGGGDLASNGHAMALEGPTSNNPGHVWIWGSNSNGQLGTDQPTVIAAPYPTDITSYIGEACTAVSAGGKHSMALGQSGTLYAWGDNTSGECGIGSSATTIWSPTQVSIPGGYQINSFWAGSLISAADIQPLITAIATVVAVGQEPAIAITAVAQTAAVTVTAQLPTTAAVFSAEYATVTASSDVPVIGVTANPALAITQAIRALSPLETITFTLPTQAAVGVEAYGAVPAANAAVAAVTVSAPVPSITLVAPGETATVTVVANQAAEGETTPAAAASVTAQAYQPTVTIGATDQTGASVVVVGTRAVSQPPIGDVALVTVLAPQTTPAVTTPVAAAVVAVEAWPAIVSLEAMTGEVTAEAPAPAIEVTAVAGEAQVAVGAAQATIASVITAGFATVTAALGAVPVINAQAGLGVGEATAWVASGDIYPITAAVSATAYVPSSSVSGGIDTAVVVTTAWQPTVQIINTAAGVASVTIEPCEAIMSFSPTGPIYEGTALTTSVVFWQPVPVMAGQPANQANPVDPYVVTLEWIGAEQAPVTWTYGIDPEIARSGLGSYTATLDTSNAPGRWLTKWVGSDPCPATGVGGVTVLPTPY
jgi:alpha-tubulin suppressor-like RCC1 family protein